jgi:hypothetical protein
MAKILDLARYICNVSYKNCISKFKSSKKVPASTPEDDDFDPHYEMIHKNGNYRNKVELFL